jgi:broad specificity phosphatase PhoE
MSLGTESGAQVFSRTERAILEFITNEDFESAAIVTHGGVLRNLFRFLKITEFIPHPIPNAALFPFLWTPKNPGKIEYLSSNPLT